MAQKVLASSNSQRICSFHVSCLLIHPVHDVLESESLQVKKI